MSNRAQHEVAVFALRTLGATGGLSLPAPRGSAALRLFSGTLPLLVTLLLSSACSGGSGDDDSSPVVTPTPSVPSPTLSTTETPSPVTPTAAEDTPTQTPVTPTPDNATPTQTPVSDTPTQPPPSPTPAGDTPTAPPVTGTPLPPTPTAAPDADGDGVPDGLDCNDASAAAYPGATEVCDTLDNNCDGNIDEGTILTFYYDGDKDGYGTSSSTVKGCSAPIGYSTQAGDCNDLRADISPADPEICDGLDNDCDASIDEGLQQTWYLDADQDGYGLSSQLVNACSRPNGYAAASGDCDDTQASTHPGAAELCDGRDNDCDGQVDDGAAVTSYLDSDKDGYGNPSSSVSSCPVPQGYVTNNLDCNDKASSTSPAAPELCDGADNDCDGQVDEGASAGTFYPDADKDGYGAASGGVSGCSAPAGYVSNSQDCNDASASVHPNQTDGCDGVDTDCDGTKDENPNLVYYQDKDADGYGNPSVSTQACSAPAGYVSNSSDCNDLYALSSPGGTEVCDGADNDCDGTVDQGVGSTWYVDEDGDGYGSASSTILACSKPAGFVANKTDCNDANASIHPGATERCDGLDNDCNGLTDDGMPSTVYLFRDLDADGFGVTSNNKTGTCAGAAGWSLSRGDCNDADKAIYPGAVDLPGLADSDCGGTTEPDPHVGLNNRSLSTLRAGLEAAINGQTVFVGPGVYPEYDLSFAGKEVFLEATQASYPLTVVDAAGLGRGFVFMNGETSKSGLDGFTVRNGNATLNAPWDGGGVYVYGASPQIINCTFEDNDALDSGGGVSLENSAAWLENNIFLRNTAVFGGGLAIAGTSGTANVVACLFKENSATKGGGGVDVYKSSPNLTYLQIFDSTADYGAGLYIFQGSPTVYGLWAAGNTATTYGGGLNIYSSAAPVMTNVRLERNSAANGGAVSIGANSPATLSNFQVIDNVATTAGAGLLIQSSSPSMSYITAVNNAAQTGAGMYVQGLCQPVLQASILSYNIGYNLVVDYGGGSLFSGYALNLYSNNGQNHNLSSLPPYTTTTEPGFLAYSLGLPSDLHLASASTLVNQSNFLDYDCDGSLADLGAYGGARGCGYDLDWDGYIDYFWPGGFANPPQGVSTAGYDCKDLDSSRRTCS